MPHYHKRIKKLSKKLAKSFHVVNHINTLNEFSGDIIEALQSVEHDSIKKINPESEEKKQVLQNVQKKKQMLATLFKNLKNIGLSYRQGMIYARNRNENDFLNVPAFDVSLIEILKYDSALKDLLLKSSQDTNHYFYKSIAQYALLQKHIESPSKDLTLDVVHRIQGYSGNLVWFVIKQRYTVVEISKNVDRIGCFLATLSTLQNSSFTEKCVLIPPQQNVQLEEETLGKLIVHFMTVLKHFGSLMKCAPEVKKDRHEDVPVPYVETPVLTSVSKNDPHWVRIMTSIKECEADVEKRLDSLMNAIPNPRDFKSWERFYETVDGFEILKEAVDKILSMILPPGFSPSQQITNNLCNLHQKIHAEYKRATQVCNVTHHLAKAGPLEQRDVKDKRVTWIIHRLTKEILLSYQDILASCISSEKKSVPEDSICPDNLFNVKISSYLSELENCLRLQKVSKLVHKLKRAIQKAYDNIDDLKTINESLRLLSNITPFLNQYFQLIKVYFITNLGMHRTSCKFLTILLEVFNALATKGFCIPPELQEEAKNSGTTKFEDIEDGGLGEGEGTKDVSSTIESEDQLEDAFKEGQDKKDEEDESDIKDEKDGIEMSNDFEGKGYNPEGNNEDSEGSGKEEEESELDKQMGNVDTDDAEKLDNKVWGSDSEDEEENQKDDPESGGVSQNKPSELAAKDGVDKDSDRENKDVNNKADETIPDSQNDEYQGDVPDPLIDAPPEEPEVVELPDDMEITDDTEKGDAEEIDDSVEIQYDPDEELETKDEPEAMEEDEGVSDKGEDKDGENAANKAEENNEAEEEMKNANSAEPAEENADNAEDQKNETNLPTHTPTNEVQALPSSEPTKSSSKDPVQDDNVMEVESGAQQQGEEQHKEGQADSKNALDQGAAHEGKRSSVKQQKSEQELMYKPKLKSSAENRTLDDNMDNHDVEQRPIADKQSLQKSIGSEEPEDEAHVYEHVQNKEEGINKAVDIATEEQAAIRPVESQNNGPTEENEVIELSSDDEDEDYNLPENTSRGQGDAPHQDHRRKPGERGDSDEDNDMDMSEGELVRTHTVSRGDTVIHTQTELWASLSTPDVVQKRLKMEKDLDLFSKDGRENFPLAVNVWRSYEHLVANLAQELCEQLRLVLEPTKMAKLKGDYRTGKRLNMRKIIPYIASEFRKDKIWLRRTKPSKREYQIMLAVDDSSSMSDNHSKQLAFESLATIGHSLSLLEAGELAIVSFGEKVDLLMGFNEQYCTDSGARIFQKLSFSQGKTGYSQLLHYATETMVKARNTSSMKRKETAQLLVIISDGIGVFSEGEESIKSAMRHAKNNNIFTVFIILDNPKNKDSILDMSSVIFGDKKKTTICEDSAPLAITPYLETFPFPFYIILRDISSLPLVLGEALRQWFELVISTDR